MDSIPQPTTYPTVEWLGGNQKDAEAVYERLGLTGSWTFESLGYWIEVGRKKGTRKAKRMTVNFGDFIHWDDGAWKVGKL